MSFHTALTMTDTASALSVDRFAQLLGVTADTASFERAVCHLTLQPEHQNILGGPHGGVIFSLADMAFANACNAGSEPFIGIQAEMRYISRARTPQLMATATLMGRSKKMAHYEVLVQDSEGHCVALFTSTAYSMA